MRSFTAKYRNVEDFLADEEFRRWVLTNDNDLDYFWANWLTSHPEKREMAMKAKEIIVSMKSKKHNPEEDDQENVLANILKEKFSYRNHSDTDIKYHKSTEKNFPWFKVAAIFLLFTAGLYYFATYHNTSKKQQEHVVQWILKENPRTQRSSFRLPDGTKVFLNINSSLYYPENFTDGNRLVELIGEAYFEVVEDATKPFVVVSKNLRTTALGTSFNVRAMELEDDEEIALISGRVKVEYIKDTEIQEDFLEPGQRILLNAKDDFIKKLDFNMESVVGWKDGILIFDNDDYKTVVKKIERWYGVHVNLENSPSNKWEINGRFENKSLYELLSSLRYTHGVEFKIKENNQINLKF